MKFMKHKKHTEDEVKKETDAEVINEPSENIVPDVAQDEVKEKTPEELAQEYLNDLQRLQADFANYKKRQQEAQKELAGYLIEKLVMEITPVLDNFHMATVHIPADACNTPWVTGIQYIEKQLEKVLEDNGMRVIEAKEGDIFDPRIHEAISSEEKQDEEEAEKKSKQPVVAKALQKGYKIGEKVIRPAKVTVK
jgi:molecular chaperone GrpE